MICIAQREHALLGARFFLVAPRAAQRGVEAVLIQRLAQRLGFHHVGMQAGAARDRVDAAREPIAIDVDDQFEPELFRARVAERDHLAEFPGGIDVQQRQRRFRRIERLAYEMKQDR